jgi:phthiocerol/phenolphthiocerol synthesis type-I polyketide synthase C
LAAGERVLLHSGAGGVGLAAIQVARLLGAGILATAGTAEKREYLRSLGIDAVMDSRSLDFLSETMQLTGGQGVDVILNSLRGDAISKGLDLLRIGGRFLELGKRDFTTGRDLPAAPFLRGLSFSAVDVGQVALFHNDIMRRVVEELSQHFIGGALRALPITVFPVGRIQEAFRRMTEGTHIGKLVIAMQSGPIMVEPE